MAFHGWRAVVWLGGLAAFAGLGGCSGKADVGAKGSGGAAATTTGAGGVAHCTPDIASIEATIFAPSCALSNCHAGSKPGGGLDLTGPDVAARLVDVTAGTCDVLRVAPGSPSTSFLYQKVTSPKPSCGDRMPIVGSLNAEQTGCIRDWIAGLPKGCETCGGGACVDLATASNHCGACDKICPKATSCKAGKCACDDGTTLCGTTCIDTLSNANACGGCASPCNVNEVCDKGKCVFGGCSGTLVQCGMSCIDTTKSTSNCGGCNKACAADELCIDSKCGCFGGADKQTDPDNCGTCNNHCAPGQTCAMGKCTCGNASVSFKAAVQPIFDANCTGNGCHSGQFPKEDLDLSPGKSRALLVGIAAAQCNDGRLRVKPGNPETSYLVDKVTAIDMCNGSPMPKNGMLTATELVTLTNWICEGAPDN